MMPASSTSELGNWGTHTTFAMVGEKVPGWVPVAQHRSAAADGKAHRDWVQLDTDRESWGRSTGEVVGGWMDTQHQRERDKFLNLRPCHPETKVGGRLRMIIFLAGGGSACHCLP